MFRVHTPIIRSTGCCIWFSAPSLWMGGGLESRCVGVCTVRMVPCTAPSTPCLKSETLHEMMSHLLLFSAHYTNLRDGITKCSNEVYNKFTNIHQQNKYLLERIGYMFRPVNKSSSGLQQNKSKLLLRNWDPNSTFDLFCWRPDDDLLTGRNM